MNALRRVSRRLIEHLRRGSLCQALGRRLRWLFAPRVARFLGDARGVIHVGANVGQERETYALCGLDVLWIEPVQETYEALLENIRQFPRQRAVRALVADSDGRIVPFHVASNEGGSSSMLELAEHRDIWPSVHYQRSIEMKTIRLVSLLEQEGIQVAAYDILVMDTQGTELQVLRGGRKPCSAVSASFAPKPPISKLTLAAVVSKTSLSFSARGVFAKSTALASPSGQAGGAITTCYSSD